MTTPSRDRKDTAAKLGIKLQAEYRAMIDATARMKFQCRYPTRDHVQFQHRIYLLGAQEFGGVDQMPLRVLERPNCQDACDLVELI